MGVDNVVYLLSRDYLSIFRWSLDSRACAWVSHFTYSPEGVLISWEDWNYHSYEYVWSAANRRMYHLRDGTSPNDLLWEEIDINGVLGLQEDSPYHSIAGISHPIWVFIQTYTIGLWL